MPGLATTRLPSGSNETSGAPALTARCEAIERPAARSASGLTDGAAAAAPPACALNARSLRERPQHPAARQRDRRRAHGPVGGGRRRAVGDRVEEDRPAVPVEEREARGGVQRRELVARDVGERVERVEDRDAGAQIQAELAVEGEDVGRAARLGQVEEREHQAREGGGEQLAVAAPEAVRVVEVGQPRDLRVEVVTGLGAAHARGAVGVGDELVGRLAVEPLDRQQRADRRAPAALALEHHAADEAARRARTAAAARSRGRSRRARPSAATRRR